MKLLPEVPTEEMIIAYEGSLHRPLSILGYKALWRTAPEVKDEPVAWEIRCNGKRIHHGHNAIADYRDLDPSATSTPLYAHPSPRIAELEAEVAKLRDALFEIQNKTGGLQQYLLRPKMLNAMKEVSLIASKALK